MPISVLLAGDDEFRAALAAALGDEYALVEADSVGRAADALLAAKVGMAFVDLRGRSGVGEAICRRIKGAAPTRLLPVIACADPGQDDLVFALDAGADHVLGYPPPLAELGARLRNAARSRSSPAPVRADSQISSPSARGASCVVPTSHERWGVVKLTSISASIPLRGRGIDSSRAIGHRQTFC